MKSARIAFCVGLLATSQLVMTSVAHAQDADAKVAEYASLLTQIQDLKLATAQREVMLERQSAKIDALKAQVAQAPETGASVRDIVTKMTAEIEKQIEMDLPFRRVERYNRLDRLRTALGDPESRDSDLFRQAITIYDIETNYGNSVSAYPGDNPVNPGARFAACQADVESAKCALTKDQKAALKGGATLENIKSGLMDGSFVHFGRMSFIYLDLDSREGFRWSKEANGWEPLSSGDILKARKSVRIARGESAPGVVTAPIKMQASQ